MKTPLQKIPGVGKNMAAHLESLGICCVEDLREKDPKELYDRDCMQHGYQDRCVLYVYRCAVYFAQTPGARSGKVQMVELEGWGG